MLMPSVPRFRVKHPAFEGYSNTVKVTEDTLTPAIGMFASFPAKVTSSLEALPVAMMEWKVGGGLPTSPGYMQESSASGKRLLVNPSHVAFTPL